MIIVAFKLGENTYRAVYGKGYYSSIVSAAFLAGMMDDQISLNDGNLLLSKHYDYGISTEGDIVICRGGGRADIIRLRPASTMEWSDELGEIKEGTIRLADEGVLPFFIMHNVKTTMMPSARYGLAHNRDRYNPNSDVVYARSHRMSSCPTQDKTLYTPDMWQDICAANTKAWEDYNHELLSTN